MKIILVAFADSTKTAISSAFFCAQDPVEWPYQGSVESSDPMWEAFYNSVSTEGQAGLVTPGS